VKITPVMCARDVVRVFIDKYKKGEDADFFVLYEMSDDKTG
jgi:hypothetical protein